MVTELDVCYLSIAELGEAFTSGHLSPVEVTEAYLRRIEALDGRLNSYITVTAEAALEAARAAEARLAGQGRGPLDGVPIALKDLYDTAGVPTTGHLPLTPIERRPRTPGRCGCWPRPARCRSASHHARVCERFARAGGIFPPPQPLEHRPDPGGSSPVRGGGGGRAGARRRWATTPADRSAGRPGSAESSD